jgi:hypothetical protein
MPVGTVKVALAGNPWNLPVPNTPENGFGLFEEKFEILAIR